MSDPTASGVCMVWHGNVTKQMSWAATFNGRRTIIHHSAQITEHTPRQITPRDCLPPAHSPFTSLTHYVCLRWLNAFINCNICVFSAGRRTMCVAVMSSVYLLEGILYIPLTQHSSPSSAILEAHTHYTQDYTTEKDVLSRPQARGARRGGST